MPKGVGKMKIGFLTAPFRGEPLEKVVEFAKRAGLKAIEISSGPGSKHFDPFALSKEEMQGIRRMCDHAGVEISSLAFYAVRLEPDKREESKRVLTALIDAASEMGVEIVCTGAGFPVGGKSKLQTIEEDCAPFFREVVSYAQRKGVKIALENWYATNIQNLEHWRRLFELVPDENFGLNFDPSHLAWQGIPYLAAVREFGGRIFHTHAKDTEIEETRLKVVGVQGDGWWRYVLPGRGVINWGRYIGMLKDVGYEGVLSIEHEDRAFGREEGFIAAKRFLSVFVG